MFDRFLGCAKILPMVIIMIFPHEKGFRWALLEDENKKSEGIAPEEHIALLDARIALKRIRKHEQIAKGN